MNANNFYMSGNYRATQQENGRAYAQQKLKLNCEDAGIELGDFTGEVGKNPNA